MPDHFRYDQGDLKAPVVLDNGYIKCDARLTKVGVFDYWTPDGLRKELRLPSEVFDGGSIETFALAPLTNDHPRENGGHVLLNSDNTRKFQAGTVSDVRADGSFLSGSVLITDEKAIKAAKKGKTKVSCGYKCDLEFTPGVTNGIEGVPDGIKFDAIQRNIRGNHVALVDRGRAGSDASIRIDSRDGYMQNEAEKEKLGQKPAEKRLRKMKIDGVEYEANEQVEQVFVKMTARLDSLDEKLKDQSAAISKAEARADQAEADLSEQKKIHADAMDPVKVQEQVQKRLELERTAATIIKDDKGQAVKMDGMTDLEIQKAVILKVSPSAQERLDSAEPAYVAARFDQAVESFETIKPNPNNVIRGDLGKMDADDERFDSDAARQRMMEQNSQAWKPKGN